MLMCPRRVYTRSCKVLHVDFDFVNSVLWCDMLLLHGVGFNINIVVFAECTVCVFCVQYDVISFSFFVCLFVKSNRISLGHI